MNALDSELVQSLLRQAGLKLVDDAREADVLLYNTCSVRGHAEDKVHSRLGWACQRKNAGRPLIIGVLGCMAQRLGDELLKLHPGVDIVCGPGRLAQLPQMILDVAERHASAVVLDPPRAGRPRSDGRADDALALEEQLDQAHEGTHTHLPGQAYVRIMLGCDKFCTYCIVPFVRGPERSRSPEAIEQEIRRLVDTGVTCVTLLGQTVNSYRHVSGDAGVGLADLLARLSPIAGLRRIRFVTSYPVPFDVRILEAMRDLPNVCRFLHVPAQSGSDRILKAMNRRYTRAQYDELVDQARSMVPGVSLAGDFIVGFPGETDEDVEASADLIRRSRYRNSYIFKYSPRPGTTAEKRLADDVPEATKKRRNNYLLSVQEEVSLADNQAFVGRTVEVLAEGLSPRSRRQPTPAPPDEAQLVGRTGTDHIVVFDGPPGLAGQYVNVQVTSFSALTLIGRRV